MRRLVVLIPNWRVVLALALPALLGAGAVAGAYLLNGAAPAVAAPALVSGAGLNIPPPAGLLVDVSGAVVRPGLYRLPRGDRVYDALAAAGGLTARADPTRLPNLAGRLHDGEQVKVPFASGPAGGTVITRVSLNSATLEELEVTPGFTPALAAQVIDYRINFGGFQSTSELVDVLGMSVADYVIARRYLAL
jgi:competence protein ComEA